MTSTTHRESGGCHPPGPDSGRLGESLLYFGRRGKDNERVDIGHGIILGVVLPDRSIPYRLADTIAAVSEGVWRLFHLSGEPPLTLHGAMVMARDCTLVGTKAKNELGYRPRGLAWSRSSQDCRTRFLKLGSLYAYLLPGTYAVEAIHYLAAIPIGRLLRCQRASARPAWSCWIGKRIEYARFVRRRADYSAARGASRCRQTVRESSTGARIWRWPTNIDFLEKPADNVKSTVR